MWGHVLMFRNRQVLGGSKFMKKRDPMVEYAYTLQIASNTWQPKPNFKAIEEIFLVYLEGTLYLWIFLNRTWGWGYWQDKHWKLYKIAS